MLQISTEDNTRPCASPDMKPTNRWLSTGPHLQCKMAESAQWRLSVVVVVALTSLLPTTLVVAEGEASNPQTKHNAALSQHVDVLPAGATCRNLELITLPDSKRIRCSSGCARNFTQRLIGSHRFPTDVIQMGGANCHIVGIDQTVERSSMCWLTPTPIRTSISTFTYSVWIKPTESQTKQYVLGFVLVVSCPRQHPTN